MKNKINGKKIIKYGGAVILVSALVGGTGVAVYDANIDHTEVLCPFAKMLDHSVKLSDGKEITYGMMHQLDTMKKQYEKNGEDVIVAYVPEYVDEKRTEYKMLAIQNVLEDGTIEYLAPIGYKLVEENGVYYAVKTVIYRGTDSYEAIVTYYQDGTTNYNGKTKVLKIGE